MVYLLHAAIEFRLRGFAEIFDPSQKEGCPHVKVKDFRELQQMIQKSNGSATTEECRDHENRSLRIMAKATLASDDACE